MLTVRHLTATYITPRSTITAVSGVNLTIQDSEIVGIAGESGSGKSSLLKVMYGNIQDPMRIMDGDVTLEASPDGGGAVVLRDREIQKGWWRHISYIPQGAMSVLNPVSKIEPQFLDVVPRSSSRSKHEMREYLHGYLRDLGLSPDVLRQYPHQLSGGMRQRVIIAMATFLHPKVVLADEPTTALDVVVQKSILLMLRKLQRQMSNSLVIVSHDMGVHYQVTNRLAVMYAGRIVEVGPSRRLYERPLHPYTQTLIASLPQVGERTKRAVSTGMSQEMAGAITGCQLYARCPVAMPVCKTVVPPMIEVEPDHFTECHVYGSGT